MPSAESQLGLLVSVVRSTEKLYEGAFCCLEHGMMVSALCLLYEIYHKVNHPMNENLHHFVTTRNTTASAALGEITFVIPHCRTEQISRSFLPTAGCMWYLLPLGVFSGCTLSFFQSAMTLCLLRDLLDIFFFISISVCCSISCPVSWCWVVLVYRGPLFLALCVR